MRKSPALWIALGVLAGAAPASEGVGGYAKNERWGFKVRVPDGWTSVALPASEEWIALKQLGKRELLPKDSFWGRRPEMWVVGFPHARLEERGAKVETRGDGKVVTIRDPYKDYKDFLARESGFVGGGWYIAEEKTGEVEGAKVTMYDVRVDKQVDAPLRIVAWVFHFDDIDFAVQFKILEDHYDAYRATFQGCLKSFRRIERTQALPGAARTGQSVVEVEDERDLTREERRRRRQEAAQRAIQREIETLPKGWYRIETKHYVVLANADRKFAQAVADHAEAIRAYLEKTFPSVGDDYVPKGLIRVFAGTAEERAYAETTRDLWIWGEQVLVSQRMGDEKAWELEYMSAHLTTQWLSFKNRNLAWNLPSWIDIGLRQHMAVARSKGKKVEFKPDAYDRQNLKEFLKRGEAVSLRALLSGNEEVFRTRWEEAKLQAGSVLTFLLERANRGSTKDCVRNYLAALVVAVEEAEAEYEAVKEKQRQEAAARAAQAGSQEGGGDRAEVDEEAEDEKRMEELEKALKAKSEAIRKSAFDKAFGHLTDADWQRLDAQWREYAGA